MIKKINLPNLNVERRVEILDWICQIRLNISYWQTREYGSYEPNGSGSKDSYPKDNRIPYSETKSAYPARGAYPQQADSYSPKYKDASYSPAKAPYEATAEKKYR